MKSVILDDDPTGTQSATDVLVLLTWTAEDITTALLTEDAVYLQTNTRAMHEEAAVELVRTIKEQLVEVEAALGEPVQVVLRGDSTLRGHVFPESDVFASPDSVMLFVPAFPEGGRTTVGGVHLVQTGDVRRPAAETEYAADPVFGYRSSRLVDYVQEKGHRDAVEVPLLALRASRGRRLSETLLQVPSSTVVVPDAETDEDIELVHAGLSEAQRAGRRIVVRSASPLAALCAGRLSRGHIAPLPSEPGPALIVCGSHTTGATSQLRHLLQAWHEDPIEVDTEAAFADPDAEGARAGRLLADVMTTRGLGVLASDRRRHPEHNTLDHGTSVMQALVVAAAMCEPLASVVVTKGGITAAEVARRALGAREARVLGQILPGVSLWDLAGRTRRHPLVVVPGNVGEDDTLSYVLTLFGLQGASAAADPVG